MYWVGERTVLVSQEGDWTDLDTPVHGFQDPKANTVLTAASAPTPLV
jgi:hypothetical protein